MPTAEELAELLSALAIATPSAPDWYHIIDRCVGTLLVIEVERAKERTHEQDASK